MLPNDSNRFSEASVLLPRPLADQLPDFTPIAAEKRAEALKTLIEANRKKLDTLLSNQPKVPSWDSLLQPLEALNDRISQAWSVFNHLNSVCNRVEDREFHQAAQTLVNQYFTDLSQNKTLLKHSQTLAESDSFQQLNRAQQQTIQNLLRDFHLAGVDLPEEQQKTLKELRQTQSTKQTEFANHVMDATQGWYKHLSHASSLSGLPDNALTAAANAAKDRQKTGYLVTLDAPSYLAVMTYAEDRQLRAEVYHAYVTRASERYIDIHGSPVPEWDNSHLIQELLSLRHRQAELLNFNNYAELSLARKMADSPQEVDDFLVELAEKSRPQAEKDLQELEAFAKESGVAQLQAWDLAYFSEKLKEQSFGVSSEVLRPYFPVHQVLEGLFLLVERLFNISIQPCHSVSTWHESVDFFQISRNRIPIAGFYLDLYARSDKRGGAWMDECRVKRTLEDTEHHEQLPVAYLVCNFAPPTDEETPALLTHNDVCTLFHEMGHGLHHMLTQVSTADVSGINGVEWDAVELPSQFMENWCWQPEVLKLISRHYQTEESLPADLLEKLIAAKNFQSGLAMLRQLEFALFDWRLHWRHDQSHPMSANEVLSNVRDQVAVIQPPEFNRFANSFNHIFAGGYSAGYYSYKWAEVLSSDAFARFEEEGLWNPDVRKAFSSEIMEVGGSRPAKESFKAFRLREPCVEALLRHSGLTGASEQPASHSSSQTAEENHSGNTPLSEDTELDKAMDAHYHHMPQGNVSASGA